MNSQENIIGKSISNYEVIEKIGGGGMGVVYKALDQKLDRVVALKFLPPHLLADKEAEQRFIAEAKAASSFDHPNICTIYDINKTEDEGFYIAMACYEGETLKREIDRGPISIDSVLEYSIQICKGLERAHEEGITHRDIKPDNIIVTNRGEIKILDFGLATNLGKTDVTSLNPTMGTIAYMSPEQAKGTEINNQTDIWSLGVVIYQMLTAKLPFEGSYEQAIIYSILNESPSPIRDYLPSCPTSLVQIIEKCLKKDIKDRYENITQLLNDIELCQLDPDYGFNTTKIKIDSDNLQSAKKKKYLVYSILLPIILLTIYVSAQFDNVKELMGLTTNSTEQHLLILPFTNIGGDDKKQAFCDGLMETLSSKLSQIEKFKGSLWVVPSSEVIQNKIKSPDEAQKMYGINLAVTGSLQYLENLYRLTLNLVDAVNLRQINSTVIDINESEIASLHDKSILKLLEMLHIELEPELTDIIQFSGTSDPDAFEYYVEGKGYLQRYENIENIDEAINSFTLSTKSDSLYALAYAGLGEAYWRKYESTKNSSFVNVALDDCVKAFILDSNSAPVNVTLGMIYSGTGKYEDAVTHFNKALSIEHSNASAYRGLAKAYEALRKNSDAERTYKKAIQLKPNYWAGYNDLGVHYYKNGKYTEAIEQFKNVIELTPDNYRGYNNLGGIFYMLEEWSDARDMFERSLEIKKSYNIYSNLATLYYIEQNYNEAATTYKKALDLNDKDYLTWGNLAAAYNGIPGKKELSVETYKRAIEIAEERLEINPNDPDVISNLGSYYADIGNKINSVKLIEKSLLLAPSNVQVLYRAATVYEHLGDREKAIQLVSSAIQNGYSRSDVENQPELKELVSDERYKNKVANLVTNK